MANKYFTPSGEPVDLSRARASVIRAEFASIEQGFAATQVDTDRAIKLPAGETSEITTAPADRAHGVLVFDAAGNASILGGAADSARNGQILGWDPTTGALKYWDYAATITSPVNDAADSAAAAATSETNAANSAAAAATSETNAANSAAAAATSETNAANSAAAAATSETNAANSAAAAATSASAASASEAASLAHLKAFRDTYLGAYPSAPTTDPDGNPVNTGDLYFDTTLNEMRVYDASGVWKSAGSTVNGTAKRVHFTGDGTTTTFTIPGGYDPTFADVFVNGVKLVNGVDVDVSSGTDIVFTTAPASGDDIDVVAYGAFQLANAYTKAEIDAGPVVLSAVKKVDGAGSGLDADLLDGMDSSAFAQTTLANVLDADILTKLKNVDGAGSGLDADLLRGLPADFTNSLAVNGYQKLPSGLIIQFGHELVPGSSSPSNGAQTTYSNISAYSFTFPIVFPTAVITLSITQAARQDFNGWVSQVTSSGATVHNVNAGGVPQFYWIAIGY